MIKMRGAAIALLFGAVLGCGKASEAGAAAGCTKDSDCKGDRICVSGACAEARKPAAEPARAAPPPAPSPEVSAASQQVPPANCAVRKDASFAYVNPPAGKQHAIARSEPRFDAGEAGRLPWGTEVEIEIVQAYYNEGWRKVICPPIFGKREAWMHRDVLKMNERAPAQRF